MLVVLILGSYDPETKELLKRVREELAKLASVLEHVYLLPILLEQVELYESDGPLFLVEYDEDRDRATLMAYDDEKGILLDMHELMIGGRSGLDMAVYEAIKKHYPDTRLYHKLPVMDKLQVLASANCLVFLIRHKEKTRGGEYIEFGFLTGAGLPPRNIYFIHREGIRVSEMVYELMDYFGVNLRTYRELDDLLREVRRIIHYRVRELRASAH